jgi:hypothetical protein
MTDADLECECALSGEELRSPWDAGPICGKFDPDPEYPNWCVRCEHEPQCHKPTDEESGEGEVGR